MEFDDYLGLVDFATPCGLVCKLCGGGFRANMKCLARHAKTCSKIHGVSFRFPGRHLGNKIHTLVENANNQPFDCFIHESNDTRIKYFCSDCDKMFHVKLLCEKHVAGCCASAKVIAKTFLKLKCGCFMPRPQRETMQQETNWTPIIQVENSTFTMPLPCSRLPNKFASSIEPLLHPSDTLGRWPDVLSNMIPGTLENALGDIEQGIMFEAEYHKRGNNTAINRLYQVGCYLLDRMASIVMGIPADIRSQIAKFAFHDGDVDHSWNFSHRRDYDKRVKPLLLSLLCFLHQRQWKRWDYFCRQVEGDGFSVDTAFQNCVLGSLLTELVLDSEISSWSDSGVVLLFSRQRLFTKTKNGLRLKSCGVAAQELGESPFPPVNEYTWLFKSHVFFHLFLADLLHLLRCGVAAGLKYYDGQGKLVEQVMEWYRHCPTIHFLCPKIYSRRKQYQEKPPKREVVVDEFFNIIVDGHAFQKAHWSKVVPTVVEKAHGIFDACFVGKAYEKFLCLDGDLTIVEWSKGLGSLPDGTNTQDLECKELVKSQFERLTALMDFAIHGFGCGADRFSEVHCLDVTQLRWKNTNYQDLYVSAPSRKQPKLQAYDRPPVEHKMPRIIARCLFLYRVVVLKVWNGPNARRFFPQYGNDRRFFFEDVAQEIFSLDNRPGSVVVRQFWTSLMNLLFPDSNSQALVSSTALSELSKHSQQTAMSNYQTRVSNSHEIYYARFHRYIGTKCMIVDSVCHQLTITRRQHRLEALQLLLGNEEATFRGNQETAIDMCTNSPGRHKLMLQPCGSGKTMNILVRCVVESIRGLKTSTNMFLVPYNFLASYQMVKVKALLEKASQTLGLHDGLCVEMLAKNDLCHENWPNWFARDDLPEISALGVAVTLMSGSISMSFGQKLMDFLDLSGSAYHRLSDYLSGENPKDICLFWVSLVLDTVGFERVHMSTRGYSICAYEH